ncbi:hypothetical protein [Streptomyces sp. TS71-3]|uniref:hypothetical protein n=1 Tax=Streptomyces sp. TS71-3 TaxID=2733862 RepID=UPI001B06614E|nr:hypothetical protein [Streptomyces sp. TS71-3]GHJ37418.1 hypothetical protein Sm713_30270 [Streptomyces sp. TS71-3]
MRETNNATVRFLIGLIAGVVLIVLGVVRDSLAMECVGGLLVVLSGARMLTRSRRSN